MNSTDKQDINALKVSHSLLNAVIEGTPDSIFVVDLQSRFLLVNSSFTRLFGKSADELIGKDVTTLLPPESAEKILKDDRRVMSNGVGETFEEVITIGGIEYTYLTTKDVYRDEKGNIVGLIGVIRDVTQRKQAEREHIASLHFFESMDRVNRAIQGTSDIEQMMSDVLDEVLSIFDCDRAWFVYPCDPNADYWCVPVERTKPLYPGANSLGVNMPMDAEVAEVFQNVLSTESPIKFGKGEDYPVPEVSGTRFNVQSQLAMAIYPKVDKPYMFGLHQCSYPRVWTQAEEKLFRAVGRHMADALGSLLLFRELRERERLLSEAQQLASIGSFTHDLITGKITSSAQMNRIIVGAELEKVVTFEKFIEAIHEEDRSRIADYLAGVFESNVTEFQTEYRVRLPGQKIHDIFVLGRITRDEAGKALRVFGTAQDITERKKTEIALRENEAKLAEAQEIGGFGSFEIDVNTGEGHCSPALCKIYGFENDEPFRNFRDFLSKHVHPEDLERTDRSREDIIAKGTSDEMDYRYLHPDGSERILYIRRRAVKDADGRVTKLVGTVQDITERRNAEKRIRESEARFRTFVDHATDAFFIHDSDGKILDVNCQACTSLGYSREELIGMYPSVFDKAINRELYENMNSRLESGEVVAADTLHERKDGKVIPVELRVRPFWEGGRRFAVSFARDITERKRAEESLRASLREKEILLKEVHHRVKNNLQFISSLLALQAGQFKDRAIADAFIESRNRVRAIAMVHENLYRSSDFGSIAFAVHIESLCAYLYRSYGVDPDRIALNLSIDDSTLDLDRAIRCGLIINELVSNAIKHAFPKDRSGHISVRFLTARSRLHTLTVADNGIGLPEETDPSNSDTLGLQIVSDLADQLNGKLEIERHDGTTFRISFNGTNSEGVQK